MAATIDDEVKILVDKAFDHCRQLLSDHAQQFDKVVNYLVEHESMTGKQFAACMEGREIEDDSASVLLDDSET